MVDRTFFFDQCRLALGGALRQSQVDGLNFILDAWDEAHAQKDLRWLAYALGTTYHETAFTMQPIREHGGPDYFMKMYDPGSALPARGKFATEMGAKPGDGPLFYGRGYVQLTWRTNYTKMGTAFGRDLISSATAADGALDPTLAAKIMFKGMEEGVFTGRKFSQYFNPTTENWLGARAIINGNDQDATIAAYAKKFHAALGGKPT